MPSISSVSWMMLTAWVTDYFFFLLGWSRTAAFADMAAIFGLLPASMTDASTFLNCRFFAGVLAFFVMGIISLLLRRGCRLEHVTQLLHRPPPVSLDPRLSAEPNQLPMLRRAPIPMTTESGPRCLR